LERFNFYALTAEVVLGMTPTQRTRMKPLIGQMVAGIALLAVACGSDATAPDQRSAIGSYHLKSVNGAPLPFLSAQSGTAKTEITSEAITLNGDGTFSDVETLRTTNGSAIATTQFGSVGAYHSPDAPTEFTETSPNTFAFAGSVSKNTLTVVYPSGNTFVYVR
jgi:hypothetical protein